MTVSLLDRSDRDLLDDEVWGPDSRARALREAAKVGSGSGLGGGLLQGCGDLAGCDVSGLDACDAAGSGEGILAVLAVIVAAIVFAIVGAALYFIIRALVRYIRKKLQTPKPHGALLDPPKPSKRVVVARGVVRSGKPMPLPWTTTSALGYAMELYEDHVFGGGAMVRDARTAGLEVALDDGRILQIPAGRVRILGKREKVSSAENEKIQQLVKSLDPKAPLVNARDLFPFDHVRAVTIAPGDRVEVLGELGMAADTRATGYRESAGVVVPIGTPILRVHKAQQTSETRVRVADDGEMKLASDSDEHPELASPDDDTRAEIGASPEKKRMRRRSD